MRTEVPETPEFWGRLETELRSHAPRRRRRSLGVPATAMRAVRAFTRHAVHTAAVVGLAVVLVVSWSEPIGDTARVTIASDPITPAYVAQYSNSTDAESMVQQARNEGYEVAVRRLFTPDPSEDGQILDEVHPGSIVSSDARGPVLFVIGYTVGQGDKNAN